jgi:hypothetical protein
LLRLAHAQDTVVIPAYLATIPHHLSLDSPAPLSESEAEVPLLELIEQRATQMGVRVDSRIERGRIHRHALTALLENEGYDTLAVPAKTSTTDGFDPTDIAWLLENAPGEVLVLHRLVGFTAYSPHNDQSVNSATAAALRGAFSRTPHYRFECSDAAAHGAWTLARSWSGVTAQTAVGRAADGRSKRSRKVGRMRTLKYEDPFRVR